MTRFVRRSVLGFAALLLVGCGSNAVGSNDLLNIKPTPTPTAVATAKATPVPTPTPRPTPVPHTAAPTQPPRTAPPPQAVKFPISIKNDNDAPIFDPPLARLYQGTIVVWTNHDNVARSVVANNGAFNSGPIAPGASWSWQVTSVGQYDYADGTRPYAVAQIQVVRH
jgi:plastocyanin